MTRCTLLVLFSLLVWVFVAVRGLSLVVASGVCSPVVVHGLLIVVTFLVVEHGLSGMRASAAVAHGLSSCGSWALDIRLNSFVALV